MRRKGSSSRQILGATVVEYVLLTVIILGILVILSQISGAFNDTFGQLASFIGP
jgi:Flp pilus assembly pilin Flp